MVFKTLSSYDAGAQLSLRSPAAEAAVGKPSPTIIGSLSAPLPLHPHLNAQSLELLVWPARVESCLQLSSPCLTLE